MLQAGEIGDVFPPKYNYDNVSTVLRRAFIPERDSDMKRSGRPVGKFELNP